MTITRPIRKTKMMLRVEAQFGEKLERLLPRIMNEKGYNAADDLGVSKPTLGYWLLKLGIDYRRVVVSPGEEIEVRRAL